jgi:hypothetical protein
MRFIKALPVMLVICWGSSRGYCEEKVRPDPRAYLAELRRLSAKKSFLQDSPDVYLESQSLGKFFTPQIYQKLRGNAYFGYAHDEGFRIEGNHVQIDVLKSLASGQSSQAAYRLALEQALKASGFERKSAAAHQIGLCIVGMEPKETAKTLPGVMVEAYLRNNRLKKSLFIRYGAGHPRGLPAAIRLSAEMLVAQLCSRTKNHECPSPR